MSIHFAYVKTILYLCITKEKIITTPKPYGNTDKPHNMTSKQITAERAIEAINICSEFMTENMTAYQSTLFPQCVRITGTGIISSLELEPLMSAGFYCQIATSLINDWGIEISIYDRK